MDDNSSPDSYSDHHDTCIPQSATEATVPMSTNNTDDEPSQEASQVDDKGKLNTSDKCIDKCDSYLNIYLMPVTWYILILSLYLQTYRIFLNKRPGVYFL